jgi:hypothetical protein
VHAVAEVHETSERVLLVAPVGFGVGSTAQDLPFQDAASVLPLLPPTAVQAVADMQDSPESPTGGVGMITHFTPSQDSAKFTFWEALP